jgi:uncharacterized membrane protein YgcG
MKNVFILFLMVFTSFVSNAQDDVYDPPQARRVRVQSNVSSSFNQSRNTGIYDYNENNIDAYEQGYVDGMYSNRLRRMYAPQTLSFGMGFGNMHMMPYGFNNMGFGFNDFYDPWAFNSFNSFNTWHNPMMMGFGNPYQMAFVNPYMGWNNWGYNPYMCWNSGWGFNSWNNWGWRNPRPSFGNNWGGNRNPAPAPRPRTDNPRGFGRYDETYRPSPSRPVSEPSKPIFGNPGRNREQNTRFSTPVDNNRKNNSSPSPSRPTFGGGGNSSSNSGGNVGGGSRSGGGARNGNNGGKTGRF